MDIYIAGPYAARDAIRTEVAPVLRAGGHTIIAGWLEERHELSEGSVGTSPDNSPEYARRHASKDLSDIANCDALLVLTDEWVRTRWGWPDVDHRLLVPSGGRHVEYGHALALGLHTVVVGPHENIFQRAYSQAVPGLNAALEALRYIAEEVGL